MPIVVTKNAFSHLFLSAFLTASLVACGPQKEKPQGTAAPTKLSDLPEKASACEAKIRKQMEEKSIQLFAVAALDSQIAEANKKGVCQHEVLKNISADWKPWYLSVQRFCL